MTVYIELVFVENLIVDYFLLLLCGKITSYSCLHPWYSSLLGAVYACLMPLWSGFSSLKFLLPLIMALIAFRPENIKAFFEILFVFIICTASLYGVASLCKISDLGFIYSADAITLTALFSVFFSIVFYRISGSVLKSSKLKKNFAVLDVGGNKLNAFIDSGNSLYYNGIPVVLVNKNIFALPEKPIIIPYETVSNRGALLGFKPQKAYLTYSTKTVEIKCVIALCDRDFKSFSALLHPDLIKECI